ncbi:MAG: hypothetical protein ABGY11_08210 [Candidatus Thioglobus sp.]|jgi:hypothetical protein
MKGETKEISSEGMLTGKKKYPSVIQDMLDRAETAEEKQTILNMYEKLYKNGEFNTNIEVDF